MQTAPAPYRFSHHAADGLAVYVDEPEVMHRIPGAPVAAQAARVTLAELDGVSIKDSTRMPHPVDLAAWSDAGLYRIDVNLCVFRLSAAARSRQDAGAVA